MRKTIILFWIFLNAGFIFGQQQNVDYILKARALRESGKPDQSINLLNGVINTSEDSRLLIERAESYIRKNDYSAAIRDFNEANRISPLSGEYGLSQIYALKGDASTALYHLGLSMNSPFKRAEKEIMLDNAFNSLENRAEWRQFWKKEWYSNSEKSVSEIEYYVSAGKIDDSKQVLTELKNNYNNDEDIIYAEALVNQASGKNEEVVKAISGLSNASDKNLMILAKAQVAQNNPSGASETYTRLLNSGVANADLYLKRADCYRKTGESDKAMEDVKKYLDIYPDNSDALSLAGKIEVKSGDNLQALEYFSRNLKLHPNDPQIYLDRANSYFMSKSWDMAVNDYSMSLDLNPDNSDAWLNKGISLLNEGKVEDACHDFRKSFRLGNKRVAEYLSKNCLK
jgi:tetratricopeptide (TPR) repeat protein